MNKKNMNRKKMIGIVAIIVLLSGGIGFGINHFLNQSNIDPESAPFESTIKRPEEMDDSRILIPGYNDWNMVLGTKEISVALFNPEENPCYFKFNVILDETEEVLYETGLIPPGQAVTTVRLPRTLAKGVHPITLKVDSFSLEDETQKYNSGEVKTNIVVLEE